ncbi:uncharacterized protein LOC126373207 [Pectinophora gossypiella]|uniref:uncharacterized protein LOC126373207 n=1 Tax=Pectinophora gossypiella TaxID=13191 RepID=UPI00214F2238|nr:uncharacterized protein LOC126373207 [Pectinophora gossypiella]
MKLPNVKDQNLQIDWPVLNKFLLCLPLRQGLIACGYLQLVAVIAITWSAIMRFADYAPHNHGFTLVQIIIFFVLMMIINLLDTISSLFLIMGAQKKKANFLEVVYHYLKARVMVFAGLLVLSFLMKLFVVSDYWYYRNLDRWWYYLLMDNQACGVLVLGVYFYLLLLVRSELIHLEHPIDFHSLCKCFGTTEEPLQFVPDTKPIVEINVK